MKYIYLDQNKWIDLSRAMNGVKGSEHYVEVLDLCRQAVRDGRIRFPLSLAHYMETWNQRRADRRHRLANTMLNLALVPEHVGPCTIAGPQKIVQMELEAYISQRTGEENVRELHVFGDGIGHVLDAPEYGRIKPELPEGFPRQMIPLASQLKRSYDQLIEKELLRGPHENFPVPWIDHESYYDLSNEYLRRALELRDRFENGSLSKQERRGALAGLVVKDILDIVATTVANLNSSREVLELSKSEGALELVLGLPSQHVLLETMARSFDNPQFPRSRGDMHDLTVVTTSVPYCDVVVMEKSWGAQIKQTNSISIMRR